MSAIGRPVVITGASSGVGRATARHLDRLGYRVFAGVRTQNDGEELRASASDALTPLLFDVTDASAVAAAVDTVARETGSGLFALINNAGVSLNGPLELVPPDAIRRLIDVNVLGLMAISQAFIPLLRADRGRLINVGSGHGLLAVPDKSVYAASKCAVRTVSDSLRLELEPFGVAVCHLVVGKVDTAALGKVVAERERLLAHADPDVARLYAPLFEYCDRVVRGLPGIPPDEVARVVSRALAAKRPKARYLVGPGARKMRNLARLPTGLRDRLMYRALYGRHRR